MRCPAANNESQARFSAVHLRFRSRCLQKVLTDGFGLVAKTLIVWVRRMNPTLNHMSEQDTYFKNPKPSNSKRPDFSFHSEPWTNANHSSTETGKNNKAETLHPIQNLLLHLPGHFTSEIFYSLSFLETQQNAYLAMLFLLSLSIFLESPTICKARF